MTVSLCQREIVPVPPITLLTDGLITLLFFCFYGRGISKKGASEAELVSHMYTLVLWWHTTTEALEVLLGKVRAESRVTDFCHSLFH